MKEQKDQFTTFVVAKSFEKNLKWIDVLKLAFDDGYDGYDLANFPSRELAQEYINDQLLKKDSIMKNQFKDAVIHEIHVSLNSKEL